MVTVRTILTNQIFYFRIFWVLLALLLCSLPPVSADIELPPEVRLLILEKLDIPSILSLGATHKSWYSLLDESSIQRLFRQAVVRSNQDKLIRYQKIIAAGLDGSCGIQHNGLVKCGGPRQGLIRTLPSFLGPVKKISMRKQHACVVTEMNSAECWGANSHGEINRPVMLRGNTLEISAGWSHTCGIDLKGHLHCWGNNEKGQTQIPSDLGTVNEVSAGNTHTCVRETDGQARCWGDEENSQLIRPPSDLGPVLTISAGDLDTCAIKVDGTLACWGMNRGQELDFSPDLKNVNAVSVGPQHTCILKNHHQVECRGDNTYGQLNVPAMIQGQAMAITTGWRHTCATRIDGINLCWGDYHSYQDFAFPFATRAKKADFKLLSLDVFFKKPCTSPAEIENLDGFCQLF